MPNIAFIRKEIKDNLRKYRAIWDCIEGQETIKRAGDAYLPRPNASDVSPENIARYKAYLERAVFYNVTKRTLSGLVHAIFAKPPVLTLPSDLKILEKDANGGSVGIEQLAKRAAGFVLAFGRAGLLVDYPSTNGEATRAQIQAGYIRPTINTYKAEDVVNWRTQTIGGKVVLSLVVLKEKYTESDDGFEIKLSDQWRVLRLIDGAYEMSVWRKTAADFAVFEGPVYPTDSNGNLFDQIPFTFIGCDNNDELVDNPPLEDIAALNIAHYRNSADYEESAFIVGQPTPYFSGLTQDWVERVFKGTIPLGARAAVPLPVGANAGLLQAAANTMPFEAMEHKERQMVALGAKLVEQQSVQRTATESNIENAAETSILASVANNVSDAFEKALEWCAMFAGTSGKIEFRLNTEFNFAKMTSAERSELIKEWQSGAISFTEMRDALRKDGVATQPDDIAQGEIDEELSKDLQAEVTKTQALAAAAPDTVGIAQ